MKRKYFVWAFAAIGYVSLVSVAFMKSITDGMIALGFLSMCYSAIIYTTNEKTNYSKELIDDAIYLYNNIDSITNDIVHARLNNDEEANKKAISRMETAMCGTQQFLKCIIERKDNIVDLGEVWHGIDVEPQKGSWFVGQIGDDSYDTFIAEIEGKRMKNWLTGCNIKRWAYIKDLLPKGGDE